MATDEFEPGTLGDLLLSAYGVMEDAVAAALAGAGFADIRPVHSSAFQQAAQPGATVTSMAQGAGVTKQHMSQVVAELEALGYLVRTSDPGDRRVRTVGLTERGRHAAVTAARALVGTESQWRGLLGPEALNALVDALLRIVRNAANRQE
jgi:DNA-binding MarR family transcriptional regulator